MSDTRLDELALAGLLDNAIKLLRRALADWYSSDLIRCTLCPSDRFAPWRISVGLVHDPDAPAADDRCLYWIGDTPDEALVRFRTDVKVIAQRFKELERSAK